MPRPITLQPKYCHHITSGRAYVRIAGRQVWLGEHGTQKSKDKYLATVAAWVARGRPDKDTATQKPGESQSGPTITTIIEPYWNFAQTYYQKNGEPTAEVGCVRGALRLFRTTCGDLFISQFDSLTMLAIQQRAVEMGWSRKTVNSHMGRVRRCLKWLASRKLISVSVFHEAALVRGLEAGRTAARETAPKRPVPADHIDAVKRFVSKQVWALIQLQIFSGARSGELMKLRPMDIDQSKAVWVYSPQHHKTQHHGHNRTIFFGPEAQAVLRAFLMRPDDAFLFSPVESESARRRAISDSRTTPIKYGNRPGTNRKRNPKRQPSGHYSPNSYRVAVRRGCDKADAWAKGGMVIDNNARVIPQWHPHRLRHNAATTIRAKYGVEAAKLAIGVQSMDVAEIYAEKDMKRVEQIFAEVG